jgi:hypothetical protein
MRTEDIIVELERQREALALALSILNGKQPAARKMTHRSQHPANAHKKRPTPILLHSLNLMSKPIEQRELTVRLNRRHPEIKLQGWNAAINVLVTQKRVIRTNGTLALRK